VHQIRFRPGLRPGPRWRSLQRSPKSLSWFKGALLIRGRGGELKGGEENERNGGKGEEGRRLEGREGERPPYANSWICP